MTKQKWDYSTQDGFDEIDSEAFNKLMDEGTEKIERAFKNKMPDLIKRGYIYNDLAERIVNAFKNAGLNPLEEVNKVL